MIFIIEHLGCDFLLAKLSMLLLEMTKPCRDGQIVFCVAEDGGTDPYLVYLGYLMMRLPRSVFCGCSCSGFAEVSCVGILTYHLSNLQVLVECFP